MMQQWDINDYYPLRQYVGGLDYFRCLPSIGKTVIQSTNNMGLD